MSGITAEKVRGAITSTVSGGVSTGFNFFGVFFLGLSAPVSTAVFVYLVGSTFGYLLDIVFAKKMIDGVAVPYGEIARRFGFFLSSLVTPMFFKFVVVVIIETVAAISILRSAIRKLDDIDFMTGRKEILWRNFIVASSTATVIFFLFGNMLRFDWAYSQVENITLHAVILMWMSLSVMMLIMTPTTRANVKDQFESLGGEARPVEEALPVEEAFEPAFEPFEPF